MECGPHARLRGVLGPESVRDRRLVELRRLAIGGKPIGPLHPVAVDTVKLSTKLRPAPGVARDPWSIHEWWSVAHVLTMTASEIRNPFANLVEMEADNRAIHGAPTVFNRSASHSRARPHRRPCLRPATRTISPDLPTQACATAHLSSPLALCDDQIQGSQRRSRRRHGSSCGNRTGGTDAPWANLANCREGEVQAHSRLPCVSQSQKASQTGERPLASAHRRQGARPSLRTIPAEWCLRPFSIPFCNLWPAR